jgi:hypothetical protein
VHFKRVTYLIEPTKETRPLAGKRVQVHESDDGKVEISCQGIWLPYSVFDKHPHVPQGAVVENKRLGELLSLIQAGQERRDEVRLASKKITLRQRIGFESKESTRSCRPSPRPQPQLRPDSGRSPLPHPRLTSRVNSLATEFGGCASTPTSTSALNVAAKRSIAAA